MGQIQDHLSDDLDQHLLLIQWALSQGIQGDWMVLLNQLLMSLTTVLTVFSGGNYLIKNIDLLKG